jgi:hypothetical protein
LPKNKVTKCGVFFDAQNMVSNHRVSDTIHHVFTTKTPPQTSHFFPTPIKKARKTEKNRLCGR